MRAFLAWPPIAPFLGSLLSQVPAGAPSPTTAEAAPTVDMNTLQFIASLVASLAWPITAVGLVLLLRGLLLSLAPLIRLVKYGDLEVSFGREIAELNREADTALPGRPEEAMQRADWVELTKLATVRPRSAVRSAWRLVETHLVQLAQKHHLSVAASAWEMPMVLGALLLNAGALTDGQYSLLSNLRKLVSDAERAPTNTLSGEDAEGVVALAMRLSVALER